MVPDPSEASSLLRLVPDGRIYTFNKDNLFYVSIPTDHAGIFQCKKDLITTSITPKPDGTYDTTDFDSHINASDFIYLTAPGTEISEWKSLKEYKLGDKVFLHGYYDRYYICAVESISQDKFSVTVDGDYPYNEHNQVPEHIVSAIRNEGFYQYPRGSIENLQFVPKWPGMMYLCTDENDRSLYAYTEGKGPVYGWWKYASASISPPLFVVGMIIGWLWSDLDPGAPLPTGFIKCDGTRVSKVTYAALYNIIQDKYKQPTDPDDDYFRLPLSFNQIIFTGVV
jgi:hypothetical protein